MVKNCCIKKCKSESYAGCGISFHSPKKKEKIEETCDNKSESTKSSKLIVVNNRCKDGNIVEQKDDPNSTASQLDTVIEKLKHLTITPESEQNGILRSNPKDNYLFSDILKQSCCGAPAEIANSDKEKYITSNGKEAENGAIVNSQNGFPENQKPNVIDVEGKIAPTIESKAATIMSHTCKNKGHVRLISRKPSCSHKTLQEKARIANPKFKMTIPTFCKAFPNVTSVYVFGGQEAITSMFDQVSESLNIFKTPPVTKTNTLNRSENSTLQLTIAASVAQQNMTRPTNRLQNYKINLYEYEDYKRALAMFEEAIKLCPDNYTFYFIRAQYYMKLGMYTEAVKDVQKVIEYDSSFNDGYICLAKCCIALGDISAADDAVDKAREVGGERASEALRELRACYADTQSAITAGDYARAVTSAVSFLKLCPSNYAKATKAKCLAMLGRTELALEIAEECLRNHDAEPEALYAKGLCLYYSCKLHQAVDYFRQVLSVLPLHLEAIDSLQKANRLECLAKESKKASNHGDYKKVIAINNEALTVDTMNKEYNVKLYCNNAVMYSKLNETHLAVKSCSDALKLNENSVVARKNRAKCYTRLGQYEDAVRDYETVYQIDKSAENEELLNEAKALAQEKENAYREMAPSVESLVRDKKFLEAQKLADECLQIRSSDTDVLYSKGMSFYYMGQYEEAMKLFQKIINIDPTQKRKAFLQLQKTKSIISTIKQGDDLFNSGRLEDARCKYKQAKDIDDANSNLSVKMHCKIAETYLILNNKKHLAIEEYTCALRCDNRCLEVLRERAKCYTELENYEDAIKDYMEISIIAECEDTKTWAINFIITLQEKDAYRKKIMLAKSLMTADESKNADDALKLAEECLQFDSSDIQALCVKGSCLYNKGQYQQARDQYEQVLNQERSHPTAYKESRKMYRLIDMMENVDSAITRQQWEVALDYLNQALRIDEHNRNLKLRLYFKKAQMYVILNDKQSAIKEYTKALEVDSNCLKALSYRAQCYSDVKQYEQAIEDYEKLYTFYKDEEVSEKLLIRQSIEHFKEKIDFRDKLKQADTLIASQTTENLKYALKIAEECLKFDSTDTKALCVKGLCLYYQGQYEQALDQFGRVLLLEPSHRMALRNTEKIDTLKSTIDKGDSAFISQQWKDALDYFNEAITIDIFERNLNLKLRLYLKMANIYVILNDKQSAIYEYTNALDEDSNCSNALSYRAQCYSDDKQYEQAIEDYEELYTIYKDEEVSEKLFIRNSIERLNEKIANREKLKQADTLIASRTTESLKHALKIAEECLKYDSTDTKALCVKGLCLYYKGQYEQAQDQFRRVLLLEPSHPTALKEIEKVAKLKSIIEKGDSAFISRRWKDALNDFNEALTIDEYNRNVNRRLYLKKANIYVILNDVESAIYEYTNALDVDSNCLNALSYRAQCYSDVKQYDQAIKGYEKLDTIYKDEEVSEIIRNSKERLKEKIAYREKLKQADTLIASRTTESLKDALEIAEECLKYDSTDTKALCVKGLCLYYKDQYEQALDQFRQVLLFEPSHPMARKETKKIDKLKRTLDEGNDSFTNGRLVDALNNFDEALTIDRDNKNLNVRLHCKKATTLKLISERNINAAIKEYTMALVLNTYSVEALRGRAQCYSQVKQYEDAVKDYEKLCTIDQSEESQQLLNEAKGQKNRFAQEKAKIGHKHFKRNKFRDALAMYKEAIRLDPENAEYYSNTYSCYIHLSMLKEALIDAKKAVALDAKSSKGFGGIAKCYFALGELSGADKSITKASDAGYDCTDDRRVLETLQRLYAQAQNYIKDQKYDRAIACMDQCLQSSPFSSRVKLIKSECLAMLGKIEQALEIADDCIRLNQSDVDALFVKGLCLYYNEKHDQALKYFKEVLRLSPDHRKAMASYKKAKLLQQKKEQGNEEFKMCRWQKALHLYNEALAVDQTHIKVNAKLHFNKATVYRKLNQTQLAADSCTAALELDKNYVKALTLRATCLTELEEYDCVIEDYEKLYRIDPSDDIKRLLDEAKRCQAMKSLRRNYYQILGLNRFATEPDIRRAYKQLSLKHHPDRHSGRSEFERKKQERRFKEVGEAYTVLSDPVQRSKYDAKGKIIPIGTDLRL